MGDFLGEVEMRVGWRDAWGGGGMCYPQARGIVHIYRGLIHERQWIAAD